MDVDDYVQSFLDVKVFTKDRLIAATEMLNIFSNYIAVSYTHLSATNPSMLTGLSANILNLLDLNAVDFNLRASFQKVFKRTG